ncbi:MAG: hypothetical protein NTU81_01265 [Candidatus Nomurabacteria bacterium]|nr:hypothetical protein [Candidatus Nomurabacteria bacterium]
MDKRLITTIKHIGWLLNSGLHIGKNIHNVDHEHDEIHVNFYPKEISFVKDDNGEKLFLLPVSLLNNTGALIKHPIPIFICNFTAWQKTKIINCGKCLGFKILLKHFTKPSIYISYDDSADDISGLIEFEEK